MGLIDEIHEPKVAMVPIGDRFTMGPKTAAFAVKRFFKLDGVIPCHYGSFPMVEAERGQVRGRDERAPTKVIVPEKGKAFSV